MQWLKAWRRRRALPGPGVQRVEAAGRYLMRHLRMPGRLDGLATQNVMGEPGFVLVLQTPQRVPAQLRVELQAYFERKLRDLGELRGAPLILLVRDAEDLSLSQRTLMEVGSAHMAAALAAANATRAPAEELADRRRDIRQRLDERRQARRDRDFQPHNPAALTQLGSL